MTMSDVKRPHRHQKITQINDNYLKKQSVGKNFTKKYCEKAGYLYFFQELMGAFVECNNTEIEQQ